MSQLSRMMWWVVGSSLAVLASGCTPDSTDDPSEGADEAVSIRVSPAGGFVPLGDDVALTVEALDASGAVVAADVEVVVSSSEVLAHADGRLDGVAAGSTLVEFRVGDVVREHLYYVTAVPDGAQTVPQDSLVEEPQGLTETPEPGSRYTVVLALDAAPTEGTVLLGEGDLEVGGRVHGVRAVEGGYEVELELLTLDEMFPDLVIQETYALAADSFTMGELASDFYDHEIDEDGAIVFRLREEEGDPEGEKKAGPDRKRMTGPVGTRAVGPFSCDTTIDPPFKFDALPVEFKLERDLDFDIEYDGSKGGLQRLYLGGELVASASIKPTLTAQLSGKLECKLELAVYTLPIGGPVALVLGGQVPIGLGFELGGSVELAQAGFEIGVKAGARLGAGLECEGGECEAISDFENLSEGVFKTTGPDGELDSQLKFKPAIAGFVYAEMALGPRWFRALRFNTFAIKGGLTLKGEFIPAGPQLRIPSHKAAYELLLEGSLGTAKDLQSFLKFVKVTALKLEFKASERLSRSPKARLVSSDAADSCHVEIDPEDSDFLFYGYNVQEVAILRHFEDDNGDTDFEVVTTETASPDQLEFDLSWSTVGLNGRTLGYSAFLTTELMQFPGWNWIRLGECAPVGANVGIIVSVGDYEGSTSRIVRVDPDGDGGPTSQILRQAPYTIPIISAMQAAPDGSAYMMSELVDQGLSVQRYVNLQTGYGFAFGTARCVGFVCSELLKPMGAISPDGSQHAYIFDGILHVGPITATGTALVATGSDLLGEGQVAWSPSGDRLAMCWYDRDTSSTVLGAYDLVAGAFTPWATIAGSVVHCGRANNLAWHPDGDRILTDYGYVFEVGTGLELQAYGHGGEGYTYSPDGERIAFCQNGGSEPGLYVADEDGLGAELVYGAEHCWRPLWVGR